MLKSEYLSEFDLKDFGFKSIGKNVKISSDARIYGEENISIGSNVRIDDFAILSAANGYIKIGNYVFIARSAHLSGYFGIDKHDFSSMAANTGIYSASGDCGGDYLTAQAIPQKYTAHIGGPVSIGKHVSIGSSCSLLGCFCLLKGQHRRPWDGDSVKCSAYDSRRASSSSVGTLCGYSLENCALGTCVGQAGKGLLG